MRHRLQWFGCATAEHSARHPVLQRGPQSGTIRFGHRGEPRRVCSGQQWLLGTQSGELGAPSRGGTPAAHVDTRGCGGRHRRCGGARQAARTAPADDLRASRNEHIVSARDRTAHVALSQPLDKTGLLHGRGAEVDRHQNAPDGRGLRCLRLITRTRVPHRYRRFAFAVAGSRIPGSGDACPRYGALVAAPGSAFGARATRTFSCLSDARLS